MSQKQPPDKSTNTKTIKISKSQLNKQKLVDIALNLFGKKGYHQTTMRDLAKEAGVSLGSFYYYFDSKEDIVNEYYLKTFTELEQGTKAICETETKFEERWIQFVNLRLQTFIPQRSLVVALSSVAIDPSSTLSPFSDGTKDIRLKTYKLIRHMIEGSDLRFHARIKPHLETLLWFYLLAMVFYWVFDKSENTNRTFEFNKKLSPFVIKLIRASRLPFAGAILDPLFKIMDDFINMSDGLSRPD